MAVASKGTALKLSISAVFTTIAALIDLNGPDAEVQVFDSTGLDSGTGMQFDPTGYVNGGRVSGNLHFTPTAATHQALTDLITAPAVSSWKEIFPDTTEWPFSGILLRFTPRAAVNDGLKAAIEIKLDDICTYPT